MPTVSGEGCHQAPKSVSELFAHSHVFLTGVTGFVGGALLQRMLTLDPGPEKVYVLIRDKYDMDAKARLEKVLSAPLFSTTPKSRLERVQAISGDGSLWGLAISDEDREMLKSKCSLVFNAAGLISFAASYERTLRCNTLSTRCVLELAKGMPNLKAFVHVSTSFVGFLHSRRVTTIEEKPCRTSIDPIECTDLLGKVSPEEFDRRLSKKIDNPFANSYPLSKMLAECLLERLRENLPMAIVRPSNVFNAWKEPLPGWYDNYKNLALGLMIGVSLGILRSYPVSTEPVLDLVPIDMVVSTTMASALAAAKDASQIHVFNCTSGSVNPLPVHKFLEYSVKAGRKHPVSRMPSYPNVCTRGSLLRHLIRCWIFHLLPCYMVVFAERFVGKSVKRPFNISAKKLLFFMWKYYKGSVYSRGFLNQRWNFVRHNADKLPEILPPEEREKYLMDPRVLDWEDYIETCVVGTRQYGWASKEQTTEKSIRHLKLLKILWLMSPIVSLMVLYLLLTLFGVTSKISFLISVCIVGFFIWL